MLEKVHIRVDPYLSVYYNIYLLTDGRWGCLSYLAPHCCDMGQNDTVGKIELNPLSSCQVIILIARMTFNCSTSCLMS